MVTPQEYAAACSCELGTGRSELTAALQTYLVMRQPSDMYAAVLWQLRTSTNRLQCSCNQVLHCLHVAWGPGIRRLRSDLLNDPFTWNAVREYCRVGLDSLSCDPAPPGVSPIATIA